MRTKIAVLLIVLMTVSFAFTGCSEGSSNNESSDVVSNGKIIDETSSEKVMFTINTAVNTRNSGIDKFVELVEEYSDGRIVGEVIECGVLGAEREVGEAVQMGTLSVGLVSESVLGSLIDDLYWLGLPGLFYNYDEVREYYYNGWVGDEINAVLAENGMYRIGGIDAGFRYTWTSNTPLDSLDAYVGLQNRVPEVAGFLQFYEALGAVPTVLSHSETATALQTGAIDGVDNSIYGIKSQGIVDMLHHLFPIPTYTGASTIVNKTWFDNLSDEDKAILERAGKETEEFYMDWWISGEQELLNEQVASGEWTLYEATDEMVKIFEEKSKAIWDNYAVTYGDEGVAIIEKISAMREEISAKP